MLAIDAAHGFAYPALDLALDRLAPLARQAGIAVAAIRRSHHCGALGLIVARLAEAGLVGLMVANTPAAMAPAGGRRALLGTNPIACAFPMTDADPVVIDLSLSTVARGRIVQARARGEAIPEGWALDAAGAPDHRSRSGAGRHAAAARRCQRGGAGADGGGAGGGAHRRALCVRGEFRSSMPRAGRLRPGRCCWRSIRARPAATAAHLDALFAAIAAEPGVRLPGQRRRARRRRAEAEGIEIPETLLGDAVR